MSSPSIKWLAAMCGALLALTGCSNEEPEAPPADVEPALAEPGTPDDLPPDDAIPDDAPPDVDPYVELGLLWRQVATEREAADPADVDLVNALIQDLVLPPIEDAQWQVESVLASPTADFYAELVSGARTLLTMELRHRGDVTAADRKAYGNEALKGYPCSRRSRFLFVLVGNVELRATGEDPAFRSVDSIEPVLVRFPFVKLEKF